MPQPRVGGRVQAEHCAPRLLEGFSVAAIGMQDLVLRQACLPTPGVLGPRGISPRLTGFVALRGAESYEYHEYGEKEAKC